MNFNLTIKFMGFLKVLDFCELVDDLPVDGGPPHLTLVEAPHHTDVGLHDSWCDRGTERVSRQKFFVSFTDLHVCHFDLQVQMKGQYELHPKTVYKYVQLKNITSN